MDKSKSRIWGVVTPNREKAWLIISRIAGHRDAKYTRTMNPEGILFEDGVRVVWFSTENTSRGIKFDKVWVDKSIEYEYFEKILSLMLIHLEAEIEWI